MSNILVTGGAGFIASHVTDELIKNGNRVIVLDDLSGGCLDNVNKSSIFIKGSITDNNLIDIIFQEHKIDYVFHMAAYAAEGLSHFIKRFNYNNNLIGSVNLINASILHKIKCFVFTSSIAVYGKAQLPMKEDMTPQPEDPYGIAKYAVEQELKVSHNMFGLNYIIFRPHNVYGERQNIADRYRNVIGIFMNQIMRNEPVTIFGDGKQTRAFSYIADVAPVIARSINAPDAYGETFNIGADTPYSIKELVEVIAGVFESDLRIKYLRQRNEVTHAFSEHSKIKLFFGDIKNTPLAEGVKRMAEWAKSIGPRKSEDFNNIEIRLNLPQGW